MSVDFNKLPPVDLEIRTDPTEFCCVGLSYLLEYEPKEFAAVWAALGMDRNFAEWITLARKTFEVLQRRKWDLLCRDGVWYVGIRGLLLSPEERNWQVQQNFTNPFTAVVETEEWYKKIEKGN